MSEEKLNQYVDPSEFSSRKDVTDGRNDPSGRYPRAEYIGVSSVNNIATGARTKNVYLGGSAPGIDLDLSDEPASNYTQNQVKETATGHIIEYDDTYGRERIMLRHRTGSGIEMRADGSVILSSTKNSIKVVAADDKVVVEGDGEIVYNGNLKLRVQGDFDLEVGGNYSVKVAGDEDKFVKGSSEKLIVENYEKRIIGNSANFIAKASTETILGNKNHIVKGDFDNTVEGNTEFAVKGEILMTSADGVVVTSPDVNISASSLAVMGDSGTVGGEEIVMYGKTAHIPRINATEMTSTTFRGDLVGTATQAIDANQSAKAVVATGLGSGAGTGGHSATDTTATNKVTATITKEINQEYLNKTDLGIKRIQIDPNDDFAEKIDRSRNYGGLSKIDLTTERARSKLRDPNNLKNQTFTGALVSANIISKNFAVPTPVKFGRIVGPEKNIMRGAEDIGTQDGKSKTFKVQSTRTGDLANYSFKTTFVVDHKYNPIFQDNITSRTRLADGVSMAKFLGGYGDPVTMNSLNDKSDRLNLAKQYMLHAEAMKTINEATGSKEFENFRLEVLEGFYVPEVTETLDVTDGVNHFKTNGQTVVYHLINNSGEVAIEKTFDLAVYWKDHLNFEKLTIDYDTYNPDGTLHACIILKMPKIVAPWTVTYENLIETRFNNTVQTTNELMEILDSTENIENIVVT